MAGFVRALLGGKRSLEQYRKERKQARSSINCVDGVQKPTQRRITLSKDADSRFGADLCKISGRVFVLKVDETKVNDAYGEYLPAMRAGLSRFDEVTQIDEQDIGDRTLATVYHYLQESSRVNITVADHPLLHSFTIAGAPALEQLSMALAATGNDRDLVYTETACVIPEGEAIVEVNGELVLGVTLAELSVVLQYAADKSEDEVGAFNVTTLPVDVAAAFLSAYVETTAVYGSKDWKAGDLLRRSLRHSKRRNSTTLSRRSSMTSLRGSMRKGSRRNSRTGLDQETIERARAMMTS